MRRGWIAALAGMTVFAVVIDAILMVPGVGSWLADTGRDLFGPAPVAFAEEVLYGAVDSWDRWRHGDEAPQALWNPDVGPYQSPLDRLLANPDGPGGDTGGEVADTAAEGGAFPPEDFRPLVASNGDGRWSPYPIPADGPPPHPAMYRAMVHPDRERPYAAVAVVAMDVHQLAVRVVPGTVHPITPAAVHNPRTGMVPAEDRPNLVALFNGGWETKNGNLGMIVDGETLLPLNNWGCAILLYEDDHIGILPGPLARKEVGVRSARQAVPCLVQNGHPHKDLDDASSKDWGSAIGGKSIVRRSAVGLDTTGQIFFYGVGDSLSAKSLADAMVAAGATTVAMLDINQTFPFFFALDPDTSWDTPTLLPILKNMLDPKGAFLDHGYYKDFFYVVKR